VILRLVIVALFDALARFVVKEGNLPLNLLQKDFKGSLNIDVLILFHDLLLSPEPGKVPATDATHCERWFGSTAFAPNASRLSL
jgi:hypothetical protein